jgi:magnesium transporter
METNNRKTRHRQERLLKESVAHIMTEAVPTAPDTATIGDVEQNLFRNIDAFRSINYTYILDAEGKLVGIISIKELFRFPKETRVTDAMRTEPVVVRPSADRERAAHLALRHNIKAIPVIDEEGTFLGVVLNDAILRTLHQEMNEDLFGLAGVRHTDAIVDTVSAPLWQLFGHRLPWLVVGLLGSLLAAGFIHRFEATLEENLLLAAFIPLVVYVSSAVAEQTQAFAIRDLAINPALRFSPYLFRQAAVTFFLAVAVGLILFGLGTFFYGSLAFGLVLAASNFLAILSSVGTGFVFPYFSQKLFRIDPANAGGPVAQVVQDVSAVLIYFSVAAWLL